MYKELDGISTLGLVGNKTGREMFENIWDKYYKGGIERDIHDHIISNCIYDDNYKIVDERLQPLVGVYQIDCTDLSHGWKKEFINMFNNWGNRLPYTESIYKTGALQFRTDYNKLISMLIYATDFNEGYVYCNGRKTKILKHIKNKIKLNLEIKDTEIEQLAWYKFYVKKKETKQQLYLVITNSIASQLGMSSYSPITRNGRVWSSCQNIGSNSDGYARSVPSNLTDEGSLICYLTDGENVNFDNLGGYEHHAMISRWMLRMLKDADDKVYLALDRAYPHDAYAPPVIQKIAELSRINDIDFAMHENYNSSQSDKVTSYDSIETENAHIYVGSIHPIMCATITNYQIRDCSECEHLSQRCPDSWCRKSTCSGCDWQNEYRCDRCDRFDEDCLGLDCMDCQYAQENCTYNDEDIQEQYSHYDDQNETFNPDGYLINDTEYKYDYTLNKIINTKDVGKQSKRFKFNDKVRMINHYHSMNNQIGTIVAIQNYYYGVKFDNFNGTNLHGVLDEANGEWVDEHALTLEPTGAHESRVA